MTFPKYPEVKDSGVEWLGEVPAHWKLGSFRHLIKALSNGTTASQVDQEDDSVAVSRIETISKGEVDFSKVGYVRSSEADERFFLNVGDILFSHINSLSMIGNAAVYEGGRPLLHGMNLLRVQPEESVASSWVAYWLKSKNIRQEVESRAKPAINQASISTVSVKSLPALIPPEAEQGKITAFLDYETARIDALVEEQRRLIELLKEKRQAVISHAVTKGLDPDVPMKDSGVEWLGEVPAHWEVLSLRRVTDLIQTGGTPSTYQPSGEIEGGIDWFTPGDFGESLVLGRSMRKVKFSPAGSGEVRVFPSDSVYLVGIGATLGKVGYAAQAASANQQINVLVPCSKVHGYFLAYSMSVKREAMKVVSNASTIGIINQDKTKGLMIAVPPAGEQSLIVDYLDDFVSKNRELIKQAEQGVSLLQERRSALISAAVTGKIDVRGWQPPVGSTAFAEATQLEAL